MRLGKLETSSRFLLPFTIFAEHHGFGFFLRMEARSGVILGAGSKDSGEARLGFLPEMRATACKM